MKPDEVRKLIGGYATGTLTDQERRALFEAALTDQALFNELAGEQALKDLLEDPEARLRLLDAVRPEAAAYTVWWKRPLPWAVAGSLATAALLVTVFVRPPAEAPKAEPVLVAKREEPSATAPTRDREGAAPAPNRDREGAATTPTRDRQGADEAMPAVAAAPPQPAPVAAEREAASRQFAAGALAMKSAAAPAPVPYRLLQADADGGYTERPPQTVFGSSDRVRVVLEPPRDGHLTVTSGARRVLLDADVSSGARPTVEVPAGESRLTVAFDGEPPFEILIRRE